jgi:HSP20 family protein
MRNIFSKVGLVSVALASSLSANSLFMNDIDRDFENIHKLMNKFNHSIFMPNGFSVKLNSSYPNTDFSNLDDKYIVKFEVAGMKKDDIKVTVSNDKLLTVEGEKKNQTKKDEKFFMKEIFYGKFKKSLSIPKDSNINKLSVDYKNGILTVTIPKDKNYKDKNIKVIPIK